MNRRQSQDFSSSIKSFNVEESCKSSLSVSTSSNISKSSYATATSTNILNKTVDLTENDSFTESNEKDDKDDCNLQSPSNATATSTNILNKTVDLTKNDSFAESNEKDDKDDCNLQSPSLHRFSFHPSAEATLSTALSKITLKSPSRKYSIEKDSLEETDLQETSFKDNVKRAISHRMSIGFQKNPINFTEKLVSILEESFMNSYGNGDNKEADISLNKITEEFIKFCKNIEDESMPDMAPSFCDTTFSPSNLMSPNQKLKTPDRRNQSLLGKFRSSPLSTLNQFSKISSNNSTPLKNNDDTNTFEYLEKICNNLYNDEDKLPKQEKLERAPSDTSLSSIYTICEQQMASLEEESFTVDENKDDLVYSSEYHTPMQSFTDEKTAAYNASDIEKNLQEEIMKYWQTRLEFAKEMEEIDKNDTKMTVKAERQEKTAVGSTYLLKTINRCKEYKNLLTDKIGSTIKLTNYANQGSSASNKLKVPSVAKSRILLKTPTKSSLSSVKTKSLSRPATGTFSSNKELQIKKRKLEINDGLIKTPKRQPLQVFNSVHSASKKNRDLENKATKDNIGSRLESRKQYLQVSDASNSCITPAGRTLVLGTQSCGKKATTHCKRSCGVENKNLAFNKTNFQSKKETPKHVANLMKVMADDTSLGEKDKTEWLMRTSSPKESYFVTPGKGFEKVKKKIKKKGMFFSDENLLASETGKSNDSEETLSCSTKTAKYQNVVSPLSKYINYKSINLLQNAYAVNNEWLLTPVKDDSKNPLKIPLSPIHSPKPSTSTPENKDPNLPKVNYRSTKNVRVIKNSPRSFPCRGVLEPINNKVVLKHAGRIRGEDETEMSLIEERPAF